MNKKQKYRNWKESYLIRHKSEKRKYLLKLGIGILVIVLLYSWYTGRLTFFAQPTDYTKGVIIKTESKRTGTTLGLTSYIQYATYSYTIDGEKYDEGFFPTKSIGRLHIGDTVNVQYSLFFNGLSKVVDVINCSHKN